MRGTEQFQMLGIHYTIDKPSKSETKQADNSAIGAELWSLLSPKVKVCYVPECKILGRLDESWANIFFHFDLYF